MAEWITVIFLLLLIVTFFWEYFLIPFALLWLAVGKSWRTLRGE